MMMLLGLIIIVGIILVIMFISSYNKLVALKNRVENAWAQIDVQLKRRADLIPNLVEIVKGYMKHEQETLEKVIKARSMLMSSGTIKEKAEANNMLTSALKSIFALSEAYPELKANENFKELQQELTKTEDKIAYARQFYNDAVMIYNTKLEAFPTNFIANMLNYKPKEYFEISEEEKKSIKIKF